MLKNLIQTSYIQSCTYDIGGINELFVSPYILSNYANNLFIEDFKFSNASNISFSPYIYTSIDIKGLDSINIETNYVPEERKYIHTLTINFTNIKDSWNIVRQFENSKNQIAWRDVNGDYFIAGVDRGFRAEPSRSQFGTINTAKNNQIVLRETSRYPIFSINSTIIKPIVDTTDPIDEWDYGVFSEYNFF